MTKKTEKKEANISINTDIKKNRKAYASMITLSLLKLTTQALEARSASIS
jgi:hypothetical protein